MAEGLASLVASRAEELTATQQRPDGAASSACNVCGFESSLMDIFVSSAAHNHAACMTCTTGHRMSDFTHSRSFIRKDVPRAVCFLL